MKMGSGPGKAYIVDHEAMQSGWGNDTMVGLERSSIRSFVVRKQEYLSTGKVMDFGCGKQPYADLVKGDYWPVEKHYGIVLGDFDAILCTQVIQEFLEPLDMLHFCHAALKPGGHLVLTGPTCWREFEAVDKQRLTQVGIRLLLVKAGFDVISVESRASINLHGFELSLGYGAVAERR